MSEGKLKSKVIKELDFSMERENETDIAFLGLWVSRRADGSLNSTMCRMEDESLTDELKEKLATVLHGLAYSVEPHRERVVFGGSVRYDAE